MCLHDLRQQHNGALKRPSLKRSPEGAFEGYDPDDVLPSASANSLNDASFEPGLELFSELCADADSNPDFFLLEVCIPCVSDSGRGSRPPELLGRLACSVSCHRGGACPAWVGAPVACGSCIVLGNLVPLWCAPSWLTLLRRGRFPDVLQRVSSRARCLCACGPVRLLAQLVAHVCARCVGTRSVFAAWRTFWASSRGIREIHLDF